MEKTEKNLGLYIHIPFCLRKCIYCDFLSFPCGELRARGENPDPVEDYLAALLCELGSLGSRYGDRTVDTVFIGGGTPSVLPASAVSRLLSCVRSSFRLSAFPEITLEANPGTLTPEKLAEYRSAGVNRLSLGVQSLDDRVLSFLGRIHTEEQAVTAFRDARRAGFDNINLDLIFGLPIPEQEAFRETVEKVIALSPEHLSAYSLSVEEGTPLFDRIARGELPEPDDRIDRADYAYCRRRFKEAGFLQYEISNFAKPGRACAHNLKYWRQEEYIGAGLGASSFVGNLRFANGTELAAYLAGSGKAPLREEVCLTEEELRREYMMLGFRLVAGGPDPVRFEEKFGLSPETCFAASLKRLKEEGLIGALPGKEASAGGETEPRRGFVLTEKGLDLANSVFMEFV